MVTRKAIAREYRSWPQGLFSALGYTGEVIYVRGTRSLIPVKTGPIPYSFSIESFFNVSRTWDLGLKPHIKDHQVCPHICCASSEETASTI